jgi:threonine/homoserine/homoserine lactone efflux protein
MLPQAPELILFIGACLAMNATPGADMMFTIASGIKGGWRAGLGASLGTAAGLGVHVLAAGLGLAALLQAVPAAYEALRWAGVAWLLWLALGAWRAKPQSQSNGVASAAQAFRGAALVNVLNPKTIIFILALIPQFAHGLAQFFTLGAIFMVTSLITGAMVGTLAGGLSGFLAQAKWLNRISAGVMVALALRLAFDRRIA